MSLAQVRNRIEVGGLERASSEEKGQSRGEGRGEGMRTGIGICWDQCSLSNNTHMSPSAPTHGASLCDYTTPQKNNPSSLAPKKQSWNLSSEGLWLPPTSQ